MPVKTTKKVVKKTTKAVKTKAKVKTTKVVKKPIKPKTPPKAKKIRLKDPIKVVDNATTKKSKRIITKATFAYERVLTEATETAQDLYNQTGYGILLEDGRVQLSFSEALYLLEKQKINLYDGRNKLLEKEKFIKKASKLESKFWVRYIVFKDMRNRGYIIKTALKFGADFRVYDRGIKPGEDHAKWIVYPVHEGEKFTWFDFAAKNRVAHSTKKRLMMGVVDDENDVTYWEAKWTRP